MERVVPLVVRLYEIVDELEQMFPGRRFTPDGHMVGSIGEAWASWMFDLKLLPASSECHDARARDGRLVQIKATQRKSVGMYEQPEVLLVLRLLRTGRAEVVYNGPGDRPWNEAGKRSKNGQRCISLTKLRALDNQVALDARISVVRGDVASS